MKPRILLVEDESALRELLEAVLRRAGFRVSAAANGREAMAILGENEVALVITDIVMPEQEGIETILRIRRVQPHLPIIAMSGGGHVEPAQYLSIAKTAGATQLLHKPFSPVRLIELVQKMIGDPPAGGAVG